MIAMAMDLEVFSYICNLVLLICLGRVGFLSNVIVCGELLRNEVSLKLGNCSFVSVSTTCHTSYSCKADNDQQETGSDAS